MDEQSINSLRLCFSKTDSVTRALKHKRER